MSENETSSVFSIRRVYICGNGKCSHRSNAESVFERLSLLIRTHQLDDFDAPYRVRCNLAGCLDICRNGVILVVQPDGIYYWNIDVVKAEKIFFQHILNNEPVRELIYTPE